MNLLFPVFNQYLTLRAFVPYGVGTLATIVQKRGHNCEFFIQNEGESAREFFDRFRKRLLTDKVDLVCIGGFSVQYSEIKELIRISKELKIPTQLGSYIVDATPELVAKNIGADYLIPGEAEYSFPALIDSLSKGLSVENIPGVIVASTGKYTCEEPEYISDLDNLPFIDVQLTQMDKSILKNHCLPIVLSRGCPYKCTFCYHLKGQKYRAKSIDYIFRELDYYVERLGDNLKSLFIMDDCFNTNRERVFEFCARIKKYNLPFRIQTRIEYMDEEQVIALKDAGCIRIAYGIESASNKVLKSMRKNLTIEKTTEVLELTRKHGIVPDGLLIIGDTEDDLETIEATESWYHANKDKFQLSISMICLYPSSPLYISAVKRGLIKDEIKFMEHGCPLINASKIPENVYQLLVKKYARFYINNKSDHSPIITIGDRFEVSMEGLVTIEGSCPWCYEKLTLSDFDVKRGAYIANEDVCKKCGRDVHWYYTDILKRLLINNSYTSDKFDEKFEAIRDKRAALWGVNEHVKLSIILSDTLRRQIVCIVDKNYEKMRKENYMGLEIEAPSTLIQTDFDYLIVGPEHYYNEIKDEAIRIGIPANKIICFPW